MEYISQEDIIKLKINEVLLKGGSTDLPFLPIVDYDDKLNKLNVNSIIEDAEVSGWDGDFSYLYKYNNEYYQLTGSLYYGDFKFYKV